MTIRDPRDWSPEEIKSALNAALKEHDMQAVAALLHLLAVKRPGEAALIVEMLRLAGDMEADQ